MKPEKKSSGFSNRIREPTGLRYVPLNSQRRVSPRRQGCADNLWLRMLFPKIVLI